MSEFTKGPWVLTISGNDWMIQAKDKFETWVSRIVDGIPIKEKRANAHLIAAAPDMYEFIKNLQIADGNELTQEAWALRHKILAKAEGKQK